MLLSVIVVVCMIVVFDLLLYFKWLLASVVSIIVVCLRCWFGLLFLDLGGLCYWLLFAG